MKVNYQGKLISIYRLGKITGCPHTSLYRSYRKGFNTGEEIVADAQKHLISYEGKLITMRKLCLITQSDYRSVQRRIRAGVSPEDAVEDLVDRRGSIKSSKLTASQIIRIYVSLFRKEKSQKTLASEHGIHQSTVSDIWRHKHWDWITAPVRYELEKKEGILSQRNDNRKDA